MFERITSVPARRKAIAGVAAVALGLSGCGETVVDEPIKVPKNAVNLGGYPGHEGSHGRKEGATLNFIVHKEDAPYVECGKYHWADFDGSFDGYKEPRLLPNGEVQITCTASDIQEFPIERFDSHVAQPRLEPK
jgi:hypothetical protein